MPLSAKASRTPLLFGAAVVAASALLGYASYRATAPSGTPAGGSAEHAAAGESGPALSRSARRDPADGLAVGRTDAPVVLVEYADFRCGYCGKFARDTEPALIEKYVENGTLRIEWRNYPLFGAESERAARAAWAAGRQGRFHAFHRAAFAEGAKERGFDAARLLELAETAGVPDLDRFRTDLDSGAAEAALRADRAEGTRIGVSSTPSFLINGVPMAGAQPTDTFFDAIDAAAAEAERSGNAPAGSAATASAGTASAGTASADPSAVPGVMADPVR
ncbi:thioredoxin domain-containing protein [uncultured Streptomyces sp.]|uniref:DsbA family protein n=1 Tax=uncultured Streptomyces sp. TaxID=174707 RepID=UPI00262C2014|nr:thioredoxin domain-containing protein [uncultured Streptomyces sp.]